MFATMILLIQNLRGDKRGVTALEYGLIASLVAVVIIAAVSLLLAIVPGIIALAVVAGARYLSPRK